MSKQETTQAVPETTITAEQAQPGCSERLKMISFPVAIAVLLFGMSTWISIVGVWVEMPILVQHLPESWNLPSYLVIIIQCANLGPALYTIYDRVRPKDRANTGHCETTSRINYEVILVFVVIATAAVSMLLMSFLWPLQADVGGTQRSLALLILVSFAALSSCTSSVVFLPFMARFPSVYISAYYFGQGLCGLLPGVAGLVQGAGSEPICVNATDDHNKTVFSNGTHLIPVYGPPRFSVGAFFGFIFALLCVSATSFCCLNFVKACQVVKDTSSTGAEKKTPAGGGEVEKPPSASDVDTQEELSLLHSQTSRSAGAANEMKVVTEAEVKIAATRSYRTRVMLVIVGIVSAFWNGILPATQSYTCLPYGNVAYTLSICLSWIVGPLATLPSMLAPTSSLMLVGGATLCAVILSAFHLVLAAMSPHPILQGTVGGQVLVIVSAVIIAFSFSFVRVSVASMLRREGGRSELLWCGGITQVGSCCGAIISFILVSVVKVFERMPPCG